MAPDQRSCKETIGTRVRRARRERGMSVAEVARRVGISSNALHAIESGRTVSPGSLVVQRLARILRVRPDFLLGFSDDLEPVTGALA